MCLWYLILPATGTVRRTSSARWQENVRVAPSPPSGAGTTTTQGDTPSKSNLHLNLGGRSRQPHPGQKLCIKLLTVDFGIFCLLFSNSWPELSWTWAENYGLAISKQQQRHQSRLLSGGMICFKCFNAIIQVTGKGPSINFFLSIPNCYAGTFFEGQSLYLS